MNDNKFWSKIGRHLTEHPYLPFLYLFILIGLIIVGYSYFKGLLLMAEFRKGILVESFGMLFDLLIIGVIIGFIHSRGERRREIKRYMDEIDDFRFWYEQEATWRIRGNIIRLNKLGITEIDLSYCYLEGALFDNVNLSSANLIDADLKDTIFVYPIFSNANLEGVNFENASLAFADFENSNLKNVNFKNAILTGASLYSSKNVSATHLSNAKSLFGVEITTDIRDKIKKINPAVLKSFKDTEVDCNFEGEDMKGVDFSESDLSGSNFKKTKLDGANFMNVNLRETTNLTIEQLSKVKSLYKAKLDPDLEKQIKEKYPHLLKKPKYEE